MSTHTEDRSVSEHYGRGDLADTILRALRAAGKDPDNLTVEDLAPVDHLHSRGRDATMDLARLANISSGTRVLDVGGGLGGPARTLASEFGCAVEVLDLTEEFCRAGEYLTGLTGLADLVSFRHGSALEMPHPDASFDLAWTQHSTMNIADKKQLYAEIHRVLEPGGCLAMHEILAGDTTPIHLPVPWARNEEINHLLTPEETRTLITRAGFEEGAWNDETTLALEWLQTRLATAKAAPERPPLGQHLVLGDTLGEMLQNLARNLEEGRVRVVQATFERP